MKLNFSRIGNYVYVEGIFEKEKEGGFGSVKINIHVNLWPEFLSKLNAFDVHDIGLNSVVVKEEQE